MTVTSDIILTPRWNKLDYHPMQEAWMNTDARFSVVPAGRRSGKTEIAKRKQVIRALEFYAAPHGRFICAAPTRQQAKRIYWADLKLMVPKEYLRPGRGAISESELTIHLYNGARLEVIGMDAPERAEGDPIDWIVLDEYGNMKPDAWDAHVRPGLFTRGRPPGGADLIGVPEGRNHYYKTYTKASKDDRKEWAGFTWFSSDILPPEEIAAAKEDLDPLTYAQEYEASFVTFSGRVYYRFDHQTHCEPCRHWYNPYKELILAFDFNVEPGVCSILQELPYDGKNGDCAGTVTAFIDEVWIQSNSTTPRVCHEIIRKYGGHKGDVICYGDPAGGARGTAKVRGSDWDIIRDELMPAFGNKLSFNVMSSHPSERSRINAVNSRLRATSGTIRMIVDPQTAVHTAEDLDGCRFDKHGHIDKKTDKMITHLTDGLGYYIEREYPVEGGRKLRSMQI